MTPLREMQLVEMHRRGGPGAHDAINELVRGYQRRVFAICARMVRNKEDAADLTQDILLKIVESLDTYNGQSKLSTWVIRVAINACLSHLRREKTRPTQSLDQPLRGGGGAGGVGDMDGGGSGMAELGSLQAGLRSREPFPGASVEQGQLQRLVLEALDRLDADSRAILILRDVQDLDYEQLAEALELPVGTVKSRLFRARAALRDAVKILNERQGHDTH